MEVNQRNYSLLGLYYRASEMIFQTRFEYTRDLTRFGRRDVIRVSGGKGIKTKWRRRRLGLIKEIILFWGWLRYRASEMIFHCQFVLIDVYIGFIGFIDQRRGC